MKKKILIVSVVLMALVISFCVIKKVCEERAIMNSKQEREEKYSAKYAGTFTDQEWKYLQKHGDYLYLREEGGFWYAEK